jgi:hypothetical protein
VSGLDVPLPPLHRPPACCHQGFALFATGAHARQMVELLSGMQFDDESTLRAEMAHKNMFLKVRHGTGVGQRGGGGWAWEFEGCQAARLCMQLSAATREGMVVGVAPVNSALLLSCQLWTCHLVAEAAYPPLPPSSSRRTTLL